MAVEFYTMARLAFADLGLRAGQQDRAISRSRRLSVPPRVSGPLLRDSIGLSTLLLKWSKESPFLDDKGKPKVLSIRGPGTTFETLARRHLPNISVDEVVEMACATAEVARRPGGKIALLGGVMINFATMTDTLFLAHVIRQVSQLLKTMVHNRRLHGTKRDEGRPERIVIGLISRGTFKSLMQELRPQIHELIQHIEALIEHRRPKTRKALKAAPAVSLGLFVAQEMDLERVGVDVLGHIARLRKRGTRS